MKFTLLICSWNRASMLMDTLHSVLATTVPADCSREILVVDNASTDDTARRVSELVEQGDVRLLHEARPGLSHARNTGLDHAEGDWIVFLDDDVFVGKDFLDTYVNAIARFPECDFWGGPVVPVFEGSTAKWIDAVREEHPWCFSAVELGTPTRLLEPQQTPFGANMCVRRQTALHHRFDTALGYSHGNLIPGEETAYFAALRRAGHVGGWNAEGRVLHRLPAERATIGYLSRRALGQGTSDARESRSRGRSSRWVFREVPAVVWRIVRDSPRGMPGVLPHALALLRLVSHARFALFAR